VRAPAAHRKRKKRLQAKADRKVRMYAVIKTGGKQYRVSPGETVEIEKLPWGVGSELELHTVLAVCKDPDQMLTGEQIANAKVLATIVGHGRSEKVRVFKFKRKKQYKRTIGHRQDYTTVKVTEIVA
jgi:large subunit ribosomal protein L21